MTYEKYEEYANQFNDTIEWRQLIFDNHLQDYDISNTGLIRRHSTGNMLRVAFNPNLENSYGFINIKLHTGNRINTEIHRLVGMMFIPIPDRYIKENLKISNLQINHKDEVKYHNNVDNLEWMTQVENIQHSLQRSPEKMGRGNVSTYEVFQICQLLSAGKTIPFVARIMNVPETVITSIRYGRTHTDISSAFKFPVKYRLTESDVREICSYISEGYTNAKITEITGVGNTTLYAIRNKHRWAYISDDYVFPKTIMSREEVENICRLLSNNVPVEEIAKKTGASERYIKRIRRKEIHKSIANKYTFNYEKYKCSDETVHKICQDIVSGKYYIREIAERNGVSTTFVKALKSGKHRKDIASQYGFYPKQH